MVPLWSPSVLSVIFPSLKISLTSLLSTAIFVYCCMHHSSPYSVNLLYMNGCSCFNILQSAVYILLSPFFSWLCCTRHLSFFLLSTHVVGTTQLLSSIYHVFLCLTSGKSSLEKLIFGVSLLLISINEPMLRCCTKPLFAYVWVLCFHFIMVIL